MEAPPLERKLAAILVADIEGYSRLMHDNEELTLATLTAHRAIVDRIIERAHGQIFGSAGDSVLAEFPSIVHAFRSAVGIQQAMRRENETLPEERRMHFRIGINIGDVLVKDGDIFGDGVNIAARLEALADVGGICVTRGVRDHLRDRVAATFEDLGEYSVKNIARPLWVFRAIFDEDQQGIVGDEPLAAKELPESSQARGQRADIDDNQVEVAFWESVQQSDDPAEYQLYLEHFPKGQFAALAGERLAKGGTGEPDPVVEVAFWETASQSGSDEMVTAYLQKYPEGQFASLAKIILEKSSTTPSAPQAGD